MNSGNRKVGNQVILSLCMIVKDEEENLACCLDCVQDIVDEIIVVDTGSSDRTIEIAKSYGAKIFHFRWSDDFSAARNVSITNAIGSYILWLDADDRLDDRGRSDLLNLKRGLPVDGQKAFAFLIVCRNNLGDAAVYYQTRIFPNIKRIRFEGRVHESLDPSLSMLGIKTIRKDIEIIHTGYDDSWVIRKKVKRNLKILLDENEDTVQDPVECFKISQCYFGLREFEYCLEYLNRAREVGPESSFYKSSYTMLSDCLLQLNRHHEAIALLENALAEFPDSGYLNYLMGAAHTLSERFETGLFFFAAARKLGIEIEGQPVLSNIECRMRYYEGRCKEGLGKIQDALCDYDAALENSPNDPDLLEAHGLLLLRLEKFQEGLKSLQKARERSSRVNKRLWLTLAKIYQFANEVDEAGRLYSDLLSENNADIGALSGMLTMGIEAGSLDHLAFALERLLDLYQLRVDNEILTIEQLPSIFLRISRKMSEAGEESNAASIAELADRLSAPAEYSENR